MSHKIGRFMVAIGAMIEDPSTGNVLLLKRTSDEDYFSGGIWEYITGRIDQFEDPIDGLRREIKEEAGIDVEVVKLLSIYHIFRGEKIADNELVGIVFWCKAKSTVVTLSKEHTDHKWVTAQEALEVFDNPGMKSTVQSFMKERLLHNDASI